MVKRMHHKELEKYLGRIEKSSLIGSQDFERDRISLIFYTKSRILSSQFASAPRRATPHTLMLENKHAHVPYQQDTISDLGPQVNTKSTPSQHQVNKNSTPTSHNVRVKTSRSFSASAAIGRACAKARQDDRTDRKAAHGNAIIGC